MDHGSQVLQKLIEAFDKMSTTEYLALLEQAKSEESVSVIAQETPFATSITTTVSTSALDVRALESNAALVTYAGEAPKVKFPEAA